MKTLEFYTTKEFDKDLKKLIKKFRTLPEDIELLKKAVIELRHIKGIDNAASFAIHGFYSESVKAFKVKKFACMSLKGKGVKSGMRLIYLFNSLANKVVLIEIYYKGVKADMSPERLTRYYDEMLNDFSFNKLDQNR